MIRATRDDGLRDALALSRSSMRLTTLMEILEAEIGVSPSARASLDALVAERAQTTSTARTRGGTPESGTDGGTRRREPTARARFSR